MQTISKHINTKLNNKKAEFNMLSLNYTINFYFELSIVHNLVTESVATGVLFG